MVLLVTPTVHCTWILENTLIRLKMHMNSTLARSSTRSTVPLTKGDHPESPMLYDVNVVLFTCYYIIILVEIDITRFMRTSDVLLFHTVSLSMHLYVSVQALMLFGFVTTCHLVSWLSMLGVSVHPCICCRVTWSI